MSLNKITKASLALFVSFIASMSSAFADGVYLAKPGQLGFMEPATQIMRDLVSFHDILLWICIVITLFVMFLMIYIFVRFNAKSNPNPSTTTHNTLLEVVWTTVPILILIVIAVPSFRLLYDEDVIPEADLTVKAIGNQWYWTYEYPDHDDFTFDATMLTDEEAAESGLPRLLATDNHIVVPVNKTVRVIVTANDVIHAWTIPAFGAKVDAVPGKLNETWFRAEREGMYYGQCSELCGKDHGFMPIMVEVVSEEKYNAWIEMAKEEYAAVDSDNKTRMAALSSRPAAALAK